MTPTPATQANATVTATTDNGKTVNLTLKGNITSSQMSNVTIATSNATTTGLFFTVTGESGNLGFSNITVPKSLVLPETTPLVFIDELPAQNQGYTQDALNYYVWYTTHFSIHRLSIVFTAVSSSLSSEVQSNLNPAAIYGTATAVAILVIISVIDVLKKERKAQ